MRETRTGRGGGAYPEHIVSWIDPTVRQETGHTPQHGDPALRMAIQGFAIRCASLIHVCTLPSCVDPRSVRRSVCARLLRMHPQPRPPRTRTLSLISLVPAITVWCNNAPNII